MQVGFRSYMDAHNWRFILKIALLMVVTVGAARSNERPFTLDQVLSAPFPSSLIASHNGTAIAWVLDEKGARNIWVAEAPNYLGRRLTDYQRDDGQEIAELEFLPNSKALVYTRGGDFHMGRDVPNAGTFPLGAEQTIWSVSLVDGRVRKIGIGHSPAVSPQLGTIAYIKDQQIWATSLNDAGNPAVLIGLQGSPSNLRWSPDGSQLAFVSNRDDHSFIAVYNVTSKKVLYLDPTVDRDVDPVWSPNGNRIAFLRIAATNRTAYFTPNRIAEPWSIWVSDPRTGHATQVWESDRGVGSVLVGLEAHDDLFWGTENRLIFPWEKNGWLHLYSVPLNGGSPIELTQGSFEVEHVALSPDGREVFFSSNQNDMDRRHVWRVPVKGGTVLPVTSGSGIEWCPTPLSSDRLGLLRSDAHMPARAAIVIHGIIRDLAPQSIPPDFPGSKLVVPEQVIFASADGLPIHAQLFSPSDSSHVRHPAIVFVHGGSSRQMLLGWHYMDYYHNAYALNQFLASEGYIVFSVNYRGGTGYGLNFREAINYGAAGASEVRDVLGAGLYLRSRPDVDPNRIGIWGGSWGGFLTAMALSRASDLFTAGVDMNGVADWNVNTRNYISAYDPLKNHELARLAFESSPISSLDTWRSPVLFIHGDDDRNVSVGETIRLVEELRGRHVHVETEIFPDDVHDFLLHQHWIDAYRVAVTFFDRYLGQTVSQDSRSSKEN